MNIILQVKQSEEGDAVSLSEEEEGKDIGKGWIFLRRESCRGRYAPDFHSTQN